MLTTPMANDDLLRQLTKIRRDIHQHPELAFREHRTAEIVADRLKAIGVEVHEGIGGTGVVGVIRKGEGARMIGLRADMDALPMQEDSGVPYASIHEGCFHGCGHDGHTTMLLGAAEILQKDTEFDGTIILIFQPAEEGEGGAIAMMEDGLFDRFPVSAVYGLHNWPRFPLGTFAVCPGPLMAAFEKFDITIKGRGGHAALPHESSDPIPAMAALIQSMQTVVSRELDPAEAAVLSITQCIAGSAYNVIPDTADLLGCTRYFSPEAGALLNKRIQEISNATAALYNMEADVRVEKVYTALVNDPDATDLCVAAAQEIVGQNKVRANQTPIMASEDFAFMLEQVPGCYVLLGTGKGENDPMVHNPGYDFNDDAIAVGVNYWVTLARKALAA